MKIFRSYFLLFAVSLLSCKKEQDNKGYLRPSGLWNPKSKTKSLIKPMTQFSIKPFVTIEGVGAASGLVYHQNKLFIVGDNSGFLYKYDLEEKSLESIPLFKDAQDLTSKKTKADFEAITINDGYLEIYASGSTNKRNKRISFHIKNTTVQKNNQKNLYNEFKVIAGFSEKDLNIEGVFKFKNKEYYFQRGNGENARNGIFTVELDGTIQFTPIILPVLLGIESGFTDAIVVDGKCYFLTTAENTSSTYLDGEIMGSIFGCMDLENFVIEYYHQIATTEKLEGITLYKTDENSMTFLLCEDNDVQELKSNIYELIIYK